MVVHDHFRQLFPKFGRSQILTSLDRITQPITDFIRGNPLVATAAFGIGTTGLIAGIAGFIKRRKKKRKATARRKRRKTTVTKRRRVGARRKVTHRSPRHKGHRRVTFKTKTGKTVNFLVRKKAHSHRRRKRTRRK